MAGRKRPSFLKRQKEQGRLARAAEKREARRARKHDKASRAAAEADQEARGEGAEPAPVDEEETQPE